MRRLALLALVALAGCGRDGADGPPAIRHGETACSECRMHVLEERFAAAGWTARGEPLAFDDVGCLVRYVSKDPSASRLWVHDHRGEAWIPAAEAGYVHAPDLATPMGSGLVAAPGPAPAEALARELGGRAVAFGDLASLLQTPPSHSIEGTQP